MTSVIGKKTRNMKTNFNSLNDYTTVITYETTNGAGVTSCEFFTKTITVKDTTPPTASNPNNVNAFCLIPPDILAVIDESDNCAGALTVTHISDVSDGGTNPEMITRTYRVADLAGNFTEVTQTITVNGIQINTQPNDVTVNTVATTAPKTEPLITPDIFVADISKAINIALASPETKDTAKAPPRPSVLSASSLVIPKAFAHASPKTAQ